MAGPIAKRRISIDPRQIAIDFDALASEALAVATAAEAVASEELLLGLAAVASVPAEPRARSIDAAGRVAARLAPALGLCEVVFTDNRRTVLSTSREPGRLVVRMHRIFEAAGDDMLEAVGRYLAVGDRRASAAISRFVDENRAAIAATRRPRTLEARGSTHDLRTIFGELEQDHFAGVVDGVGITWGRRGTQTRRRQRTIRLGTYSHDERVIRVHPTLDQGWVPRFFVRFIVFHEMLHHVEPPRVTPHRTEFHTPAFRARERAYPEYERSIAWERANLGRLLRS